MKNDKNQHNTNPITRREFVGRSALALSAVTIVPRHVLGGTGYTPPSDKLNIACVGAGGKGVVILSFLTSQYSGTTTGSPTVTTSGDNTILQFNASGTYLT